MFHNFILNATAQARPTIMRGVAFTMVSDSTGQLPKVASKKNLATLNGSPPINLSMIPIITKATTTEPIDVATGNHPGTSSVLFSRVREYGKFMTHLL
jgi:hypothetical protein